MKRFSRLLAGLLVLSALAAPSVQAEVSELRITKQPGVIYLPLEIMEHDKLIEKQAKKMGLGDLKVKWVTFTSGGAASDALLSGNIHLVCTGSSNLLLLWDRTNGDVKGVVSASSTPMWLVTRNPNVHSIKDFTEKDKIAVPTVKVSTQAMFLQMASAKTFGAGQQHRLDKYTVAMGHPDAAIALANPRGELDSHFSGPPYQQQEMKLPGVHRLLRSDEVFGGPHSNATFFATTKFHDANPKVLAAFRAAVAEADALIKKNPREAAQKYLAVTHEKYPVDEIANIIKSPENIYSPTPFGTMKFATFMHQEGLIKKQPASWKDVYFPEAYNLPGN